jgi:hypothetical protein
MMCEVSEMTGVKEQIAEIRERVEKPQMESIEKRLGRVACCAGVGGTKVEGECDERERESDRKGRCLYLARRACTNFLALAAR